ncbi:MAG: 2-C-methyl-D-erythritol 4-phosphate cytidylyltransferase [Chloroflexi bacterium]|nr:2-C-methyl-D-erythritol 4-phosphate cytidylyltransferase [Chloroflexota bacterium]
MGGPDKIFADLSSKPLIAHTVEAFQDSDWVDHVVLVLSKRNLLRSRELASYPKMRDVCLGGMRRQDSVKAGLKRLADCEWVVIHDGARPFVTVDLIEQGLLAAQETGAAIAAVPVKDTIKVVNGDSFVQETPPRKRLWAAQTPQVFRFALLWEAYKKARGEVTDDAMLVERLGHKVKLYMGSYENIKVTTSEDLAVAGEIACGRKLRERVSGSE